MQKNYKLKKLKKKIQKKKNCFHKICVKNICYKIRNGPVKKTSYPRWVPTKWFVQKPKNSLCQSG